MPDRCQDGVLDGDQGLEFAYASGQAPVAGAEEGGVLGAVGCHRRVAATPRARVSQWSWFAVHSRGLHQVVVGLVPTFLTHNRWHIWVIHYLVNHVEYRTAHLSMSPTVFGPCHRQPGPVLIPVSYTHLTLPTNREG